MEAYKKPIRRKPIAEINVVPYIDVMLVLLVIFMITAPLLKTGVDVDLPKAAAKAVDSKNEQPLILSVNVDGEYFLNIGKSPDKAINTETLLTLVSAVVRQKPDKQVLVRGDRKVDYGAVVHAMALLQSAGVAQVGLMTEQP